MRVQGGRDNLAGAKLFRSQCLLVAETVLFASRPALPFTALQSVHTLTTHAVPQNTHDQHAAICGYPP